MSERVSRIVGFPQQATIWETIKQLNPIRLIVKKQPDVIIRHNTTQKTKDNLLFISDKSTDDERNIQVLSHPVTKGDTVHKD